MDSYTHYWETVMAWLGKVAAVLLGVVGFIKAFGKFRRKMASILNTLTEFVAAVKTLQPLVARIDGMDAKMTVLVAVWNQPVWLADGKGNFKYANDAYLRLAGRPTSQIVGQGWLNSVVPEERAAVSKAWEEAVADGASFYLEFRLKDPAGNQSFVACSAQPTARSANGVVAEYLGTLTFLRPA